MKRKALQVTLEVREPSVVDLTVGEKVQLDRLSRSDHRYVAKRHGPLLDRGLARLALGQGLYFFRTLSAAKLTVVCGGVNTSVATMDKDPWPDPPSAPPPTPNAKGDDPSGEAPEFTIE